MLLLYTTILSHICWAYSMRWQKAQPPTCNCWHEPYSEGGRQIAWTHKVQ